MTDLGSFPHPSQRMPVLADSIVATSQPLAAQAGLRMLLRGGNAVDAALAAAIALTVVEPTSNGIGSDAFAIVWDGQGLHGLNASGRSPAALNAARFLGRDAMPRLGWDAVTVPGAVSAWAALSTRFGALDFAELFVPAMAYARDGFPVSPITAAAWSAAADELGHLRDFAAAFLPSGRAPGAGERFALPDQARTLARIARSGGEDFYRGEIAERIATCAHDAGAALTGGDLAAHSPEWVTPLVLEHRGVRVHELPPNGQGVAALSALGTIAALPEPEDEAARLHVQIEAMKLALADARRHVADPASLEIPPQALIDRAYLAERARLIDPAAACDPLHGAPPPGGTVLVVSADAGGMAVSFIQSNYQGFGSGVIVPGTGISLQNRAAGFSTLAGHPNAVAAAKRPFHTIIPAFLTREGRAMGAFGVMGGGMQAQGHVQIVERLLGLGENSQAAIDAPRWRVEAGRRVAVEDGLDRRALEGLARRGHKLEIRPRSLASDRFGGAQAILALPSGGWVGSSDPRKDGQAVGF